MSEILGETQPAWLTPLQKLLNDVRVPQAGNAGLAQLTTSLAELETLLAQNRSEMPAELVHFLERRSYDKAARYCSGSVSILKGSCGTRV